MEFFFIVADISVRFSALFTEHGPDGGLNNRHAEQNRRSRMRFVSNRRFMSRSLIPSTNSSADADI
jgi:hypothetical protein